MTISADEIRNLIREEVARFTAATDEIRAMLCIAQQQSAPTEDVPDKDDVLEKYVPAFANSFDPPWSAMTVFRKKRDGLIPQPSCVIQGTPYIWRSERLAALDKLAQRRDMKASCNPAAKKAKGGA